MPGFTRRLYDDNWIINTRELVRSDIDDPTVNFQPNMALTIKASQYTLDILKSAITKVICQEQTRNITSLFWEAEQAFSLKAGKLVSWAG